MKIALIYLAASIITVVAAISVIAAEATDGWEEW